MILAVCLNPALDLTYTVPKLRPGTSHRVQSVRRRPGGKGVNVASVLHQQGVGAVVFGPVGGSIGAELVTRLERAGIRHRLTPIGATTRQTVTVVTDAGATVLNEPGPVLTESEWSAFRADFVAATRDAEVVTISGSLPGVGADAYGQLIELAHDAAVPVILDCDGEPLIAALHAAPDVVKINEHEAAAATGAETGSAAGVFAAAEELHALGAVNVVITRGADGVVARTAAGRLTAQPAGPVPGNPTGAGDAFTAGLAASIAAGLNWPARLRRASAWAAAAVAMPTAGELNLALVAEQEIHTIIREEPS